MGSTSLARPFPPGIHVASLTWFDNDKNQEIDWEVQTKHLEFLINSGLHGSGSPVPFTLLPPSGGLTFLFFFPQLCWPEPTARRWR